MSRKKIFTTKKPPTKNVALPIEFWKILKQHSLDIDKNMGKILSELIEDNIG